jgi:hypothetical protein
MIDKTEASLIKALSARRRPRILYHYTSASALIGILQSRTMWTTGIRFLNDTTEYKFAVNLARDAIQRRVDKVGNQFDLALNNVLLERLKAEVQAEVYVTSFTEKADQLSQWRAYCPPTGGYAIGFRSKALLQEDGTSLNCFLVRCVYNSDDQWTLVSRLVQAVDDFAAEKLSAGLTHDRIFRESFKLLGRLLPLLAPALKDASFAEEQEWRLVHLPMSFEEKRPQFRVGRSMIVPYYEHVFPSLTDTVPIEELVVGPTVHPQLALDAAQALLSSNGLNAATVKSSSIPYRTW